jgi:hypothetical protein
VRFTVYHEAVNNNLASRVSSMSILLQVAVFLTSVEVLIFVAYGIPAMLQLRKHVA